MSASQLPLTLPTMRSEIICNFCGGAIFTPRGFREIAILSILSYAQDYAAHEKNCPEIFGHPERVQKIK